MADIKISDLTAASSVADANEFEINEAGTSKKVTAAQIKTYMALPKVYAVRLTQSGSGDPSGTAAANTTGATVALARTGAGYASVTFSSAVLTTGGKTIIGHSGRGAGGYTDPKDFAIQVSSTTVINIGAFRASDQTAEDDWVLDLTVTIYP